MTASIDQQAGIYIAYPTSPILKSIYKAKNYKTKVNDQHTKVGKAEQFSGRKKGYMKNFDDEVEFRPVAIVPLDLLKEAEETVKDVVKEHYNVVRPSKEWFHTTERDKIIEIITEVLAASNIEHELINQ